VASTGGIATHAGGEDVAVLLAALVLVDQHEAARVAQLGHGSHRIHALEGGQHHGHLEGQLVLLVHLALVVSSVANSLPGSTAWSWRW
jgi:hypothetical protein